MSIDRFKPKKHRYYVCSYLRECVPDIVWKFLRPDFLTQLSESDAGYIMKRVDYYNRIDSPFDIHDDATYLKYVMKIKSSSMYRHDIKRTTRWFDGNLLFRTDFFDVNWDEPSPTIVKSRPINDSRNNVIMKLDRCRHFNFIKDPYSFSEKKDTAIFRADIGDEGKRNRVSFMEQYFGSDICDCGSIRNLPGLPEEWLQPKMRIKQMLEYKYNIALEGNDVATNLKWIMSSNSLAVMPKPTCETWFMENMLKPDYHYIEINPDYTDLEEKLEYYRNNPDKAEQIIRNAHEYIRQFEDRRQEELIEYLVLLKYFCYSGQMESDLFQVPESEKIS